ncbi:UDP-glucose:glycoprotein glucosyltransferase-domain-containing protein [Pyronema domesticum]|nr:UDP-glucose:glycoprotein glucosyltransferase-domain-containing protein [Pyronema domesticum]
MRIQAASLLLLASLFSRALAASPAVNVGLKASWNSAPLILELLETAALENEAAYFPLLDRISAGALDEKKTDKELYDEFLRLANDEGFLKNPEELSSFNLALSIHAAAPRIEAHYHFYDNNMGRWDPDCNVWVQLGLRQICSPKGELDEIIKTVTNDEKKLQFDRTLGTQEGKPTAILYADIMTPQFKRHHDRLKRYADQGKISYRLRYRRPYESEDRPIMLSGYGVSLVLKKTDYIVMDDRDVGDAENAKAPAADSAQQPLIKLENKESQDIKPISKEDMAGLGYKAASFIMASEDPFGTLQQLVQDFPKHSATIAAGEVNESVAKELDDNFAMMIGGGKNLFWVNGLLLDHSQVNAFALLDHLRGERKHIKSLQSFGLESSEAIKLLSHPVLAASKEEDKALRFDYRDDIEGGDVLIWMNDIEKDSRYSQWSDNPMTMLRRIFPGQLHPMRINMHHLVVPIDLTSKADLSFINNEIRQFIERKIAIRFGLVPLLTNDNAKDQSKIFYYLRDTYGLETALKYFETALEKNDFSKPSEEIFDEVIKGGKLRKDKTALPFELALAGEVISGRLTKLEAWSERMGFNIPAPPVLINGQPVAKEDDWMSSMSDKLQMDVQLVQRYVYETGGQDPEMDLRTHLLQGAAKRRNSYIFPEKEADVKMLDVTQIIESNKDIFEKLPSIDSDKPEVTSEASIWVVGDFDQNDGYDLLNAAAELQKEEQAVNLVLINNPESATEKSTLSSLLFQLHQSKSLTHDLLRKVLDEAHPAKTEDLLGAVKQNGWALPDTIEAGKFWKQSRVVLEKAGVKPGEKAIIINGRVVGPIPKDSTFVTADFQALLDYELTKRIKPVLESAQELGVIEKVKNSGPHSLSSLTSAIALATVPEVPNGLFSPPESTRSDVPGKMLSGDHTAISLGDASTSSIHIVATIDPASELAQKWVPLISALSSMSGVYTQILLNPVKQIGELPVKRFYRHVLSSKPSFDEAGRLESPVARFENIPEGPLLSLSMDVPPAWLVSPKESIHDLDNLKLSTLKERLRGSSVEATYELESILIQGHSMEANGNPPRGAQLVLGTPNTPNFADTIIMANLGYFQFKANPGIWEMSLKRGRSDEIFTIDSFGTAGPSKPTGVDEDIAVLSFQGTTLFPRVSRKAGMEEADVLESAVAGPPSVVDTAKQWLSSLGVLKYVPIPPALQDNAQAEINIFSVASGHLYERFLGIMIASVMRHTDKTVKFWFISNFLSPSFKDFLPVLAEKYKFKYELVTYKWPHWLRPQSEKQREIWGYKILFLDVLFPLDLDKVIFVDADQIVRTDMSELVNLDLEGAPYGFTPMCDSRTSMEGYRFWKTGYWASFLQGRPYHISALYVVDLKEFRAIAAGDRLRQQYHQLSADKDSLANLDQDLPNHMQSLIRIKSLPMEWLWCETWCSDEGLSKAKTIDLCNNPMTKEPKLDRARRQVKEWVEYDEEIAALAKSVKGAGHLSEAKEEKKAEEVKEETHEKAQEKIGEQKTEVMDNIEDKIEIKDEL